MRTQTRQRARMLVLFVVLTAASAVAAAGGQPIGFIGVLFFGGGGAVYFYLDYRDRAQQRGRAPRVRAYHGTLPGADRHTWLPVGVVFPADRGAMVAATIGCAIFVLVGAAFLAYGDNSVKLVGVACVVVFGVFGLLGLAGTRDCGVALLPEGVYCRMPTGTAWLPWSAIGRVWVLRVQTQSSVALHADPPGAITLTGPNRWLRGINRRWYQADVAHPARALRCSARDLCAVIRRYADDPAARARLADPAEAAAVFE